jgi:hypothetical protein
MYPLVQGFTNYVARTEVAGEALKVMRVKIKRNAI